MGGILSKIGGTIQRAVSPEAREAHRAQQQRIQDQLVRQRAQLTPEKIEQMHQESLDRFVSRMGREDALDRKIELIGLRNSLSTAPSHPPGHSPGGRNYVRAHKADANQQVREVIEQSLLEAHFNEVDKMNKLMPRVPTHPAGTKAPDKSKNA